MTLDSPASPGRRSTAVRAWPARSRSPGARSPGTTPCPPASSSSGSACRAHDPGVRHATRRSSATCRRCCAARRSGASCSPSPAPARTWPACRPARSGTATSWVLNGQKVWTSGAQYSDYGAILARTDPAQPKHDGISMFIVDMHAPGVTVRPLKVATGSPRSTRSSSTTSGWPADALIGEENKGWAPAVVMLRHERIAIGTMGASRNSPLGFDSLRDLAAGLGRPERRGRPARARRAVRAAAGPCSCSPCCCGEETQAGRPPGARGSVAKLAGSELGRFAGHIAADVLGDQLAGFDSPKTAGGGHLDRRRAGQRDRRRHQRDPAQHHRRARARPGQGPRCRPGYPVQPAACRHAAPALDSKERIMA